MSTVRFVEEDFVKVLKSPASKSKRIVTLAFGDPVEVIGPQNGFTEIRVLSHFGGPFTGFVKGTLKTRDNGVLKFSMVDVQQGDGMVLETPEGKIVLIDGGDNQLFARHVAARYRHRQSSAADPLDVDAIVITHGDADHFDGLNDIFRSEKLTGARRYKRLFIHPQRIFHNGLVKGPTKNAAKKSIPDVKRFGKTVDKNGTPHVIDLFDDTRKAPKSAVNTPFQRWHKSVDHWDKRGQQQGRGKITMQRLARGMNEKKLFKFLFDEGVKVELQGPITSRVKHPTSGKQVDALKFLSTPKKSAELHLEQGDPGGGSPSASHTINGHSVAMRVTYGNVRFNLTGDLNRDAMDLILANVPPEELEAEIVKAPHHGSHDFDFEMLKAMRPVVAVCSSGDESANKEHIHPRATLMAALGNVMRGNTGVVLVTELAAFFAVKKECYRREDLAKFFRARKTETFNGEQLAKLFTGMPRPEDPPGMFFGFQRTNFGIIHVRTDGERVLVFTHSGKAGLNEAYRFSVTMKNGKRRIKFAKTVTTQ